MENDIYAVLDMKAFYASVECVYRNENYFTTPLAVVDTERGKNTIVLSVSPYLKSLGVPSRCRFRDLPSDIPGMIYATPRMAEYIKISAEIVSIVLDFVAEDDIHVYSIDELFIHLSPYLKMYKMTASELIQAIQRKILEKTRLISTAGIAPNMFLAKTANDFEGKKHPPYYAVWTIDDIKTKLWPHPVRDMWGIAAGYEKRLNDIGIYTIGEIATTEKWFMKLHFGVMGEQLWEHANGIDNTNIREKFVPKDTSFSLGQTLFRDYNKDEARLLLKEMTDDLAMRLREHHAMTAEISVSVIYSASCIVPGFSHQQSLLNHTDITKTLLIETLSIYDRYIENYPIRGLYISYGKLKNNDTLEFNLFEDFDEAIKETKLDQAMDYLKHKYGPDSISRTSSLCEESTSRIRHEQIGGHKK